MSKLPKRYSAARSGATAIVPAPRNAHLPAELVGEIASTHDGRDITRPWIYELEEFRDLRLQGAVDWGVYDKILLDDQVKSCLQQRRSAITSREWSMASGEPGEPRADAAAEALEKNLMRLSWTRKTGLMLRAPFYGIAVAEMLWEVRDGLFQFGACKVRHARRFRYDKDGKLRLITPKNLRGEILPERKFWVVTSGADDDDQPYGRGLAEWLYWPTLFKRNGIRFWNIFLDKFSVPPAKGTYPRGTSQAEIDKLLGAMMALANDSGVAIPEGTILEFMQVASNGIDFEKMPTFMDDAISRIILSQTMTTSASASGLGSGQANVHAGVKQEVITEDADMLSDSFTEGPARWFTDYNFGADVAAPVLTYLVEEEDDLKATAETDEVLERVGWVRSEESFKDVYGDGYERKPAVPAPPAPTGLKRPPEAANDAETGANPANVVNFAEPAEGDIVDQALQQIMADEGWRTVADNLGVPSLIEELTKAGSPAEVEAILKREAELGDQSGFVEHLERAGFAVKMAATAGEDGA